MADNTAVTAGSYTDTIAADDIGGVKYQRAKLVWGPDGTANDADIASGKPLPIQIRSATGLAANIAITPNPDWTLGGVQVAVHGVLQANSSFGGTEYGLPLFGRRKDSAGTIVTTDGFYGPLQLDAQGNLRVVGGGGGFQYAEDAAHTSGDTGTMTLTVRRDAGGTTAGTDGDYVPLLTDANGALQVTLMTMAQAIGSVAHDSPDTQPPVKIGGYASAVLRTAVTEGDRTDASFDLQGRLRVAGVLSAGGLGVSERAASGTSTEAHVTVDDSTANGVQLIAANASGTRRRVVITNCGTTVVFVHPGATGLTAGAVTDGRPLAGVVGAEQPWVTANELRATVDSGTAVVSVVEEVLA